MLFHIFLIVQRSLTLALCGCRKCEIRIAEEELGGGGGGGGGESQVINKYICTWADPSTWDAKYLTKLYYVGVVISAIVNWEETTDNF